MVIIQNATYSFQEYMDYWLEEEHRCLYGYSANDGDYITGYFYFYLNYSPISKTIETEIPDGKGSFRKQRTRGRDFPDFL